MDTMVTLALPNLTTLLTVGAAVLLGGFTISLALSCKAHDFNDLGEE